MRILKEDQVTNESLLHFLKEAGHEVRYIEEEKSILFHTDEGVRGIFRVPDTQTRTKMITLTVRFVLKESESNLAFVNQLNDTMFLGKFCMESNNRLCIMYEITYTGGLILRQFSRILRQFCWIVDHVLRDYGDHLVDKEKPVLIEAAAATEVIH